MKRLVVEMEDKLHTAVKMEALKQGKPAKQLVIELLQRELEEEGKDAETD